MKSNNILKYLRVSAASVASLLILPIVASIYLLIKVHTASLSEGNVTTLYLDLQNSWFGNFLTQGWVDFFSWARILAFWLLAVLAIFFAIWLLSLVMISIDNHYRQQRLANFHIPSGSWHSHLISIFLVKAGLILAIIANFVILVSWVLPAYERAVTGATIAPDLRSVASAIISGLGLVAAQYFLVVLVKLLRSVRLD